MKDHRHVTTERGDKKIEQKTFRSVYICVVHTDLLYSYCYVRSQLAFIKSKMKSKVLQKLPVTVPDQCAAIVAHSF